MESSSTSVQQEEPLDLSTGANEELIDEPTLIQLVNYLTTLQYGNVLQSNMLALMLQSVMESAASIPIPTGFPEFLQKQLDENSEKENYATPKTTSKVAREDNESTPSPTDVRRRTSSGKIDRRMVGKNCTRRVEANARERNRVQQLSKKFDELRDILPVEEDAKISKLATLKVATAYIAFLGSVLTEDDDEKKDNIREHLQLELESAKSLRK